MRHFGRENDESLEISLEATWIMDDTKWRRLKPVYRWPCERASRRSISSGTNEFWSPLRPVTCIFRRRTTVMTAIDDPNEWPKFAHTLSLLFKCSRRRFWMAYTIQSRHWLVWPVSFSVQIIFLKYVIKEEVGCARMPGNAQILLVFVNLKIVSGSGIYAEIPCRYMHWLYTHWRIFLAVRLTRETISWIQNLHPCDWDRYMTNQAIETRWQ
jgi:hypothetical protein